MHALSWGRLCEHSVETGKMESKGKDVLEGLPSCLSVQHGEERSHELIWTEASSRPVWDLSLGLSWSILVKWGLVGRELGVLHSQSPPSGSCIYRGPTLTSHMHLISFSS